MLLKRSLFILLILFTACNNKNTQENAEQAQGSYFSIVDFTIDQWNTHRGEPYGIKKTVYLNGTVDSSFTNAISMPWAPVFKVFFETDISDEKFIGRYDFSAFEETTTVSKSFVYEAKDPKLYTRKMQIVADYFTDKVTSVYIEAEKKDRLGTKSVKLFYEPLRSISIQEIETTKTGERKEMRVLYDFM